LPVPLDASLATMSRIPEAVACLVNTFTVRACDSWLRVALEED
jgi:hypothetical protein